MEDKTLIRKYKDRLRIFLILFIFSDEYENIENPHLKKIFRSEVRIQKIDFLIRNPDYLAYELLLFVQVGVADPIEVKDTVKVIFDNQEPIIRRLEMERFFFGAYEDIDDAIGFLKSIGFIEFSSKKSLTLNTIEKRYYITDYALEKVGKEIENFSSFKWYLERCELIKKYFGDLTGTQLKVRQYEIDEYKNTSYREYIGSIKESVQKLYEELYGEYIS